MPQQKRARRKKQDEPEAVVLTINGEEFALTKVQELEIGPNGEKQKLALPTLDWVNQLSFREQLEVRKIARELSGNEDGELDAFTGMDLVPGLLKVVTNRTDEDFSLDDALDFNWEQATARPPNGAAS